MHGPDSGMRMGVGSRHAKRWRAVVRRGGGMETARGVEAAAVVSPPAVEATPGVTSAVSSAMSSASAVPSAVSGQRTG